jgi:hypothetical protein
MQFDPSEEKKMTVPYLGNAISAILALIAIVLFFIGIYKGYTNSENRLPTQKALKLQGKYTLLGIACFSLALFEFGLFNNGFTWDLFGYSAALMIMLSGLWSLDYFIRSKTTAYLKSRNVSLPPSLGYRLIQYFSRKSSSKKDPNGSNKGE